MTVPARMRMAGIGMMVGVFVAAFFAVVIAGQVLVILMTALAASLALIPLAVGGEKPGNEIQTPMAIVILCGLLSSTALNMLVVPALYFRFGRLATAVSATEPELLALTGRVSIGVAQAT